MTENVYVGGGRIWVSWVLLFGNDLFCIIEWRSDVFSTGC